MYFELKDNPISWLCAREGRGDAEAYLEPSQTSTMKLFCKNC